jgi:hypothetical protein
VIYLGPGANAELVPKFHVALHASHAAPPMLGQNFTIMWPFQRDIKINSDKTPSQLIFFRLAICSLPKGGRTPTGSRQASRHETKDAVLLHS